MNYLVLKQRFYLVISVLTLIVLGSGYGSCTMFSDRLSDSAMVALDSFHHCQYMARSRGIGAAGRRSEQFDYANLLSRHTISGDCQYRYFTHNKALGIQNSTEEG